MTRGPTRAVTRVPIRAVTPGPTGAVTRRAGPAPLVSQLPGRAAPTPPS